MLDGMNETVYYPSHQRRDSGKETKTMLDIQTTGLELRALKIATELRMEHGAGEAAFVAARDICRDAAASGNGQIARVYSRVGSMLVELGVITGERALELLDPAITIS